MGGLGMESLNALGDGVSLLRNIWDRDGMGFLQPFLRIMSTGIFADSGVVLHGRASSTEFLSLVVG